MVPDTFNRKNRWAFVLGSMITLSMVVLLLGAFSLKLRSELNEAERRLTRVEINDVAEDAAERTARVATCYARARGRPDLIAALSAIAAFIDTDPTGRQALDNLIESYDNMAPKIVECDQLAVENNLDPKDFPPQRGQTGG